MASETSSTTTTRRGNGADRAGGSPADDRDAVQIAADEVRGALESMSRSVPEVARVSRGALDDALRAIETGSDERLSAGLTLSLGLAIGLMVGGAPRILTAAALPAGPDRRRHPRRAGRRLDPSSTWHQPAAVPVRGGGRTVSGPVAGATVRGAGRSEEGGRPTGQIGSHGRERGDEGSPRHPYRGRRPLSAMRRAVGRFLAGASHAPRMPPAGADRGRQAARLRHGLRRQDLHDRGLDVAGHGVAAVDRAARRNGSDEDRPNPG